MMWITPSATTNATITTPTSVPPLVLLGQGREQQIPVILAHLIPMSSHILDCLLSRTPSRSRPEETSPVPNLRCVPRHDQCHPELPIKAAPHQGPVKRKSVPSVSPSLFVPEQFNHLRFPSLNRIGTQSHSTSLPVL